MHCEPLEHLTCCRFLLGRWHLVNPASQSGAGTANLHPFKFVAWARLPCESGAIVYRSLVAIFLCLSLPSARVYLIHLQWPYGENQFFAEIVYHWHLSRSSWFPTVWRHLWWVTVIVLHDLQAVNTYPPLRGVLSHIAIAAVSYSRDRVPTTLTITGPTLTMRMAMGTSCAIQLLLLCQIFWELAWQSRWFLDADSSRTWMTLDELPQ